MTGRPKGQAKTGGRKKGTPNRTTADVKALAQEHGPEAIKALIEIVSEPKRWLKAKCPNCDHEHELELERPDPTRIAAIKELLDRGFGKSAQPVTGEDGEGPAIVRIERVIIDPANPAS